jgi:hypothetical protein
MCPGQGNLHMLEFSKGGVIMFRVTVMLGVCILLSAPAPGGEGSSKKNLAGGGRFALELEGTNAGFLKSVNGGGLGAVLAGGGTGADAAQRKHIARLEYEDFTLALPVHAPHAIVDWINGAWRGNAKSVSGKVLAVDNFLGLISERDFAGALITETTIPACDMGAKDQAYLSVKIRPESIRFKKGDGAEVAMSPKSKRKKWIPSNFRLSIKGLDCSKVLKIDSFTVHEAIPPAAAASGTGAGREQVAPGFPNLRITVAEESAESWIKWHEDFALKGNNSPDKEKSGDLELLDLDRKYPLLTLHFKGLGVFAFLPASRGPGDDQTHYACFDLYSNGMVLEHSKKSE